MDEEADLSRSLGLNRFLKIIFKKTELIREHLASFLWPYLSNSLSWARNIWASLEMPVMFKSHAFFFSLYLALWKKSILESTDNFQNEMWSPSVLLNCHLLNY